jgi:hypothetical protein
MTVSYDAVVGILTIELATAEEQTQLRRYRARLKVSTGGPVTAKAAFTRLFGEAWKDAMRWTDEQTKLAREKALSVASVAQIAAADAARDAAIGFDPEA